jgi:RimJ/RimL family protein N-acetyltransferase
MGDGPELRTERLLLRRWREDDVEPFAAMNADAEVMRFFPAAPTREQSERFVEVIERHFEERGYGLWALETLADGEFIGFTGLAPVAFEAHFTPAMEVGWRLRREAWGQGYATEAARTAVAFGFEQLGLAEIVSLTSVHNTPSRAVMTRIGMVRDPADDFLNPNLPAEHWLAPHVLYRLPAPTGA